MALAPLHPAPGPAGPPAKAPLTKEGQKHLPCSVPRVPRTFPVFFFFFFKTPPVFSPLVPKQAGDLKTGSIFWVEGHRPRTQAGVSNVQTSRGGGPCPGEARARVTVGTKHAAAKAHSGGSATSANAGVQGGGRPGRAVLECTRSLIGRDKRNHAALSTTAKWKDRLEERTLGSHTPLSQLGF